MALHLPELHRDTSQTLLCCRGHVSVIEAQRWQLKPARTESELEQLEAAYRILDLYIWLSFRMEAAFTGCASTAVHAASHM